jgi:N-acetylmuramoyl-L-alanine amidase
VSFKADSRLVAATHPAANVEPRRGAGKPSLLIMHYTGMAHAAKAIDWLAREESRVSCHYVIDEDGRITQMVPERLRAWHAGVSQWHGETDINSRSIGIEIHNPGHNHGYPRFPKAQMLAVIALGKDIVRRNAISPVGVLAHSDVAPERKIDPGEKFDWAWLAREGLGAWIKPSPVKKDDQGLGVGARSDIVGESQRLLADYGYGVPLTGELDLKTSKVLRAFQLHFRQTRVDGRLDRSTYLTLRRLVASHGATSPAHAGA